VSAPKPGAFGEPWIACPYVDHSACAQLAMVANGSDCEAYNPDSSIAKFDQPAFAMRAVDCVSAMSGHDPEALRELLESASAVTRVDSSHGGNADFDAKARLRSALAAFGAGR
jgi:hypothetical protein